MEDDVLELYAGGPTKGLRTVDSIAIIDEFVCHERRRSVAQVGEVLARGLYCSGTALTILKCGYLHVSFGLVRLLFVWAYIKHTSWLRW